MSRWKWLVPAVLLSVLCGCIEQELHVQLHADGSGRIEVVRNLSEMERGVLLLDEAAPPVFQTMTMQRTITGAVERSVFVFDDLAAALPELENAVAMMPRFALRGDRLVVFRRHEMHPLHGMGSPDETNSFYRLEIEFPAAPTAAVGTVEGNRFVWAANHEELTALQKSEIGTPVFECSLPASAITLDLHPRVVRYQKAPTTRFGKPVEPKRLSALDVRIPVIAPHTSARQGQNGTLEVFLPVDLSDLPLCYENLRLERLVIDGRRVDATLESTPSGVFFGADQWGREAPGLPVKLRFGWNSNVLKTIDALAVSMQAAVPTRLSAHPLPADAASPTNAVLTFAEHAGKRFAVLDIQHAANQTAVLKAATNLDPTELNMVYLDTDYGLRYPAKGMRWQDPAQAYGSDKERAEALFGEEPHRLLEIHFPHIPVTAFELVCSLVEEKTMTPQTVSMEVLHVD